MPTAPFAQWEHEIAQYWDDTDAFKKSLELRRGGKPYVFYDGPPFATGLPHYGHLLASTIKDIFPRFETMRGRYVERVWGWDCHGLPIENIVEKEQNLTSKKDIEKFGVAAFNDACCNTVLMYAGEWKKTVRRLGRWVDMDRAYKTMDKSYMESVWWVFAELWKKGLIYEGHKAMHICPRCVTPLSNFEVAQGYKDVKDLSVTAKFRVKNAQEKLGIAGDVRVIAWTTTPWTLPGNVLLAVGAEIAYALVKIEGDETLCVVAKERINELIDNKKYEVVKEVAGSALVGLTYEPLFPYYASTPNAFRVVAADFVTTENGTGVVHIAPAFGEDDYNVGKREEVPMVQHVGMDGVFRPEVTDFAGKEVKPKDDTTATDVEIIKWLAHNDALFSKAKYEHSYPHCWRCDTPLLNYATSSWFVKVTHLTGDLLATNAKTHWMPEHIKDGRFGKWLEGARDWAISRNRFWGAPLPVWKSEDGDVLCFGSVAELEAACGKPVDDLHKQHVDAIEIQKDGRTYRRIPEVLDCWFESGSMPYGQMHYPFENKAEFEAGFPAEFIGEGQDQTRGWFYTLHVLATALTRGENPSIRVEGGMVPAFRNVIVNGIILAEDGKKMSKRLKNYPDPVEIVEKYSSDALRWYLASSPVVRAEELRFSEREVDEVYKKTMLIFWNVVEFLQLYTKDGGLAGGTVVGTGNVLDRWIMARLHGLTDTVTRSLEAYDLVTATHSIADFITELSQWYVRRSRDRFKEPTDDARAAAATLREVVMTVAKLMAPFAPFISEKAYMTLGGEKASVHHEDWPVAGEKDSAITEQMETARKIVEMGLAARAEAKLKIRQPLAALHVTGVTVDAALAEIIADELNVKVVDGTTDDAGITKEASGIRIVLDVAITDSLRQEGVARELVRAINEQRKKLGFTIADHAVVTITGESQWLRDAIATHMNTIGSQARATIVVEAAPASEQTLAFDEGALHITVTK